MKKQPPRASSTASGSNPELKSTFLAYAEQVRPKVESHLHAKLSREIRGVKTLGPELVSACSALCEVCLRGGKRIRAALVFVGARCTQGRPSSELLTEIAAAVELLHAYFLVHDDWMDGDLVRRGGPSAHAMLRTLYGKEKGDAAAILAGDWGAAVANQWIAQLDLPKEKLSRLSSAYYAMQRAAIHGQLRDTLAEGHNLERTYELKTASYTVQGPLALGAIVGGAKPETLKALRAVAVPLGVAFQLRDDLIGLFSTESETGKPFGSDIKSGKFTAAASYALGCARGRAKRVLDTAFGNPNATQRELYDAVQVIESLGAKVKVERRIAQLLRISERRLREAPITTEGRILLASASQALALRST